MGKLLTYYICTMSFYLYIHLQVIKSMPLFSSKEFHVSFVKSFFYSFIAFSWSKIYNFYLYGNIKLDSMDKTNKKTRINVYHLRVMQSSSSSSSSSYSVDVFQFSSRKKKEYLKLWQVLFSLISSYIIKLLIKIIFLVDLERL